MRRRAGHFEQDLAAGSPGTPTVSQRMKPRSMSLLDLQPELADVEVERLVLVEHVDLRERDRVEHATNSSGAAARLALLRNCSVASRPW